MPNRRRLALCRYRRTPRSDPRCFGGPGASAVDRPAAEGEGTRSLRAGGERVGALGLRSFDGRGCRKDGGREVRTKSAKAGTGQDGRRRWRWPGEDKDTGCGERGAGDRDRNSRPGRPPRRRHPPLVAQGRGGFTASREEQQKVGNCVRHTQRGFLVVWLPTARSQPFPASASGLCFRILLTSESRI